MPGPVLTCTPKHAGEPLDGDLDVHVAEPAQDGLVTGAVDHERRVLGDEP